MDDNDSLDQAISDRVVPSNLSIADEDCAYRLILERARSRVTRRRVTASAVATVLVAAIVMLTVVVGERSTPEVSVQGGPMSTSTTTTTQRDDPSPVRGMESISDGTRIVGYVPQALLDPRSIAAIRARNARTMLPVTNAQGTLVGYLPMGLPFIPLAEAQQPGFDVEAVRARYDGGCEPQIGDPNFKQEFPLCPPPSADAPPPNTEASGAT